MNDFYYYAMSNVIGILLTFIGLVYKCYKIACVDLEIDKLAYNTGMDSAIKVDSNFEEIDRIMTELKI